MQNTFQPAATAGSSPENTTGTLLPDAAATSLLHLLPHPVLIWQPAPGNDTFQLLYANAAAQAQFAVAPGDALQVFAKGWMPEKNGQPMDKILTDALQGKTVTALLQQSDGDTSMSFTCQPYPQGVLMTTTAAAPQKKIRPILPGVTNYPNTDPQELVNLLQTILSTSQSGLHTFRPVFDASGELVDFQMNLVNQTIGAYIGQKAEDLSGSLASTYFPAYKTNGIFEIYRHCYLNDTKHHFDFHYEDGYDVFFNLQVMKLGNEVLVTLTDHTPLKRAQRELEISIYDLKRSNASLAQFAHASSHDLQEPLRKISVHTERLLRDFAAALDDNGYALLEKIQTSVKRMLRLVKDLLVFAEVGAGKNKVEPVLLDQLAAGVVADLELAIAERDATVEIGPLGTFTGDEIHLQQLFQNLISNALKYSRHGVPPLIRISASRVAGTDTGMALTDTERQQTYLQLLFEDNGQGFSEEEAQQIFKIFQRLPQHRTEQNGTGIGLAIVQRVVENHRGYIVAKGRPGEGAAFTVWLPVA